MSETVFCEQCGAAIPASAGFCASCGSAQVSVSVDHTVAPQVTTEPDVPGEPPGASSTASATDSSSDPVLAGIAPAPFPQLPAPVLHTLLEHESHAAASSPAKKAQPAPVQLSWMTRKTSHSHDPQPVSVQRGSVVSEIERDVDGIGKIRSFGIGFLLTVVTLGIYHYVWWYLINDELKDVGIATGDQKLAQSNPTNSVIAVLIGWLVIVPPIISIYNTAMRIKQAQRLCGIENSQTINPTLAMLLIFPGGILVIPAFIYYWYMTANQNAAIRAAARRPRRPYDGRQAA